MPLDLKIRDRAISDLEKIAVYIAKRNRDSLEAERFTRRLLDKCAKLIDAPKMGSPYLERTGVRKIHEGAYKILYRVTKTHVVILRIWDGRCGHDPKL